MAELAEAAQVELLTLPALQDIVGGRVRVHSLRRLELEDLLDRDPVVLDQTGFAAAIGGQAVAVTGGAGSIDAELCRQIARYAPGRLVILDSSEYSLYRMEQEFGQASRARGGVRGGGRVR